MRTNWWLRGLVSVLGVGLALGAVTGAEKTGAAEDPLVQALDLAGDAAGDELSPAARKKDGERKENGDKPPAGDGGKKKKDEPEFTEVIKDAEKMEGLFTVYKKDDRHLLALKPDQLDKDYMVSITRETGIGQAFLDAAQVLWDGAVRFKKEGQRVQLLLRNTRFMALEDPDLRRAVEKSFSDSLAGAAKIESQPNPDDKAVLVDLGQYFITDAEGVGILFLSAFQAPYTLDRENSSLTTVKVLPANLELGARLHFTSNKPADLVNLPDNRSMFINYRYSLTEVPAAADYIPRIADDRVGHFHALYQDFSDDDRESPYVRYISRWNLQKEEPYAAMSKPKEPITFWLENNIPKQYRKAVADGILVWNKAFERIGFQDALVVKQQPDDSDWDPADTRYATVRWFVTTWGSYAIGPSRINPFTGQIYDADIGVSEAIVRGARQEFEEQVDPVAGLRTLAASMQPDHLAAPGEPLSHPGAVRRADPRLFCSIGIGARQQAAFGRSMLVARGMEPGSPQEDQYVNDFITHVMAHEVGHTLGLRHNFRASAVQPVDQLQNSLRTLDQGLTGSVMDYIPVNIAPAGQKQGQHWQTTLGAYDHWAVEYAYTQFPGIKKPEDELPELKKITSRVAADGNCYGTDEDLSEPRTSMWDIGTDGIAYYKVRADLARELWKTIPTRLARQGEGYQVMRRAFLNGMFEFFPAAFNVSKYVGGIYTHRDHVGDPQGRLPFQPVSSERQREALAFLRSSLFASEPFDLPPDLLNKLAANRWWDFNWSVFSMPRTEFPLHDFVLAMQQVILNQLYSPVKLDRLVDLEMHFPAGQKPFTMAEMFNGLQESIWSELYGSGVPKINSFRRALQRDHLSRLTGLMVNPSGLYPEDAGTMARANLSDLRGKLDGSLRGAPAASMDAMTRAHLEETRARIEAALTAHMLRRSS